MFRPGVLEPSPAELLAELYELCEGDSKQLAAERILGVLDRQLRNGNIAYVDEILTGADVARLGPAPLIATLSITFAAKDKLASRAAFLQRTEETLRRLGDERALKLLENRR